MTAFSFRHTVENKYSHLLVCILTLFLISPFFSGFLHRVPIVQLLFLLIIFTIMRVLKPGKAFFTTVFVLGFSALFLECLKSFRIVSISNVGVNLIIFLFDLIFLGLCVLYLLKDIFSQKSINADTIKGGISIYLLVGFWWGILYQLIFFFEPQAFISPVGHGIAQDLFSYSFVTLTTLGYGDIVPHINLAQTLASLEAITGQMFIAVFIARLIGLHIAGANK